MINLGKVLVSVSLLLVGGCASTGKPKVEKIVAEVVSVPEGIEVSYRGRILGPAPVQMEIDHLDEAVDVTVTQEEPPIIERRIKVLGKNRVQVLIRLGEEPSPVAKALGLASVVVFDYGSQTTFATDSHVLEPEMLPILKRQSDLLKSYFTGLDVYVCGHTDSTGGDDHNQILSVNRAQAVADFLVAQGLALEKVRVQGFGEDYPLASNSSDEGRAANRRTEIILPN